MAERGGDRRPRVAHAERRQHAVDA